MRHSKTSATSTLTDLDWLREALGILKPPPKLSLSEWAERYAYLSAESSAHTGKWHAYPYQVGIMDAVTDPRVEEITVMKSARIGWTKIMNHTVGYHMHQDPCPMLIAQPTLDDAKGYSQEELEPMLRDTPVLNGLVTDARKRDSDNTRLKKAFPGGRVFLVGAESARGFRRITTRFNLYDEMDGWAPTTKEGDQEKLAKRRTETFWNRKIMGGSTPTIKGHSRIERRFLESDQRFYYVPCPFCKEFQTLKFANMKWKPRPPEAAYFECEFCKKEIEHAKKRWMVERGEWRATAEFKGHAGFFVWAAYSYSPNATWGTIAREWSDAAHSKDKEQIRTVVNTVLGETFDEHEEKIDPDPIIARREDYVDVAPMGACILCASGDVQDDRIELIVKAYGPGVESWGLDHAIFYGNPAVAGVWAEVDAYLAQTWNHETGATLPIHISFIDSSYLRKQVGEFTKPKFSRNIFAIRGSNEPRHELLSELKRDKAQRIPTFYIGTNEAKSLLFSRMLVKDPGPSYMHWNKQFDEEYFQQVITSEKPEWQKGVKIWKKVVESRPNEGLDLEVYNLAAFAALKIPAGGMEKRLEELKASAEKKDEKVDEQPQRQPRKSSWVRGWK